MDADVAIALINNWYTAVSLTLQPGVYLITAQITVLRNTTTALTFSVRLTDGTTRYASAGSYRASIANNITTIPIMTIISIASETTISLQSTANQVATIKAALITNDAGNNATQISAVKIG